MMNTNTQNQTQIRDFGHPYKRPRQSTQSQQPDLIVTRRPANFKRCDPAKATAKDKKLAWRILKRNATTPITEERTATRKDFLTIQEDIAWAEAVMEVFKLDVRPKSQVEPTRETLIVEVRNPAAELPPIGLNQLQADGYVQDFQTQSLSQNSQLDLHQLQDDAYNEPNSAPRPLKTPNSAFLAFIELAKNSIIVGVIDHSQPNGNIPRSQWGWIQASLAAVAIEVLKEYPGPPPLCTDAGWFQGNTKIIACEDDRSVMLYRAAIAKVGEVYSGAQLEVIDLQNIPAQPWAIAWLPETPSETMDILELLRKCNPNLQLRGWDVIKAVRLKEASMEMIFRINHESLVYLAQSEGHLNYGFNQIHMQFYSSPHEALSNPEAFAATVDPPSDTEWDDTDEDLSSDSDYDGS